MLDSFCAAQAYHATDQEIRGFAHEKRGFLLDGTEERSLFLSHRAAACPQESRIHGGLLLLSSWSLGGLLASVGGFLVVLWTAGPGRHGRRGGLGGRGSSRGCAFHCLRIYVGILEFFLEGGREGRREGRGGVVCLRTGAGRR